MPPVKRSEPPSKETVKSDTINYADRNPELADAQSRKWYLEHSGNLAQTNHEFKAFMGLFTGLRELGFDVSPLEESFKAFEKLTPDPQSRKDVLQMFAQPKIVIPGVGAGMLGGQEDKPGLIRRFLGKFKKPEEGAA